MTTAAALVVGVGVGIGRALRTLGCVVCAVVAVESPVAAADPDFGSYWHDGQAELDGYRWGVTRYGQRRTGQAVLIYVTEPFSRSKLVKVDDPSRDPADTVDVLKLNVVRDFQAGIYDYNTMVSVFTRSDSFTPLKISFSSAEWCGHVYEELRFEPRHVMARFHSYFQDESSSRTLEHRQDGVTEDSLLIVLRGLRGPFLLPGQKRSVSFLPGAFYRRLTHRSLAWSSAQIERLVESQTVEVPAGTFAASVYVVTTAQGRVGHYFVEQDHPHRVVRWTWQAAAGAGAEGGQSETDEWGQMAGTARLKYWALHDNGHERYLRELGLRPAGP